MEKSHAIFFSVFAVLSLFIANLASAASYFIKVDLDKAGSGSGQVTFTATSSLDFEFSGWSESCFGKVNCELRDLISGRPKRVIAGFNAPECAEFTYSDFSAICSLSGTQSRTITSASPPGCVGGNPITSKGCFLSPRLCAGGQTTKIEDRSLWERFKDAVAAIFTGSEEKKEEPGTPLPKIPDVVDSTHPVPAPLPFPESDGVSIIEDKIILPILELVNGPINFVTPYEGGNTPDDLHFDTSGGTWVKTLIGSKVVGTKTTYEQVLVGPNISLPPGGGEPTAVGNFDVIKSGATGEQEKGATTVYVKPNIETKIVHEEIRENVYVYKFTPDQSLCGAGDCVTKPEDEIEVIIIEARRPIKDPIPPEPGIGTGPAPEFQPEEPEFNFKFDPNFGRDPASYCK